MSEILDEPTRRRCSSSSCERRICSVADSRGQIAAQFRVDVSLPPLIEREGLRKQWPPRNREFTGPLAGSLVGSDDLAPTIRPAKLI